MSTEIILSPAAAARGAVHADAEGGKARAGVLHRPDQQRSHAQGVSAQLAGVEAFHVAAFVKELQGQFSPPTVKQHLAALRMLFDWLVTGHVLDVNPAHAVRGPKYVVKKGKTPVLTAEEARELLDSIAIVRKKAHKGRRAIAGTGACRVTRPGADRRDGLHLRTRERCAPDEGEGFFRAGAPRMGPPARKRRQGA